MPGLKDFIHKNAGENIGFAGFDAAIGLSTGESKLKIIVDVMKNLVVGTALWKATLASTFTLMGAGIRSVLHDTGSLQAAIDKLQKIQGLQKVFEPLVGGAKAARLEVAKLVNFAASNNLKFPAVAEAARSLRVMTNNGAAGVDMLKRVGDAAAGTNNDITSMADAVGQFNATLRSGGSIAGAADQLRQMGAISQSTADKLITMQEAGSTSTQVFAALTSSLDSFSGQMDKARDSIDGVNAAYEAASANLQEKFGSPWKDEDINSTKAMTSALQSIAPAVSELSELWNTLFGHASRLKDMFLQWGASSGVLNATLSVLGRGITLLVTGVSILASGQLLKWLFNIRNAFVLTQAATDAWAARLSRLTFGLLGVGRATVVVEGAMRALRVASAAIGIFALVEMIMTAANAFMNWANKANDAAQAVEDFSKASQEANAQIAKQGSLVKTLEDHHNALAAALGRVADAQRDYNQAIAEGNSDKAAAARQGLQGAKQNAANIANINPATLAPTEEENRVFKEKMDREEKMKEQALQNALDKATPEQKVALLRGSAAEFQSKYDQGAAGEKAGADYSRASQIADTQQAAATDAAKEIDRTRRNFQAARDAVKEYSRSPGDLLKDPLLQKFGAPTKVQDLAENYNATKAEMDRANSNLFNVESKKRAADKTVEQLGANAPAGTSVNIDYQIRQAMKNGASGAVIGKLQQDKLAAQRIEGNRTGNLETASQRKAEADALERENRIVTHRAETEYRIAASKEEGFNREEEATRQRKDLLKQELGNEYTKSGGVETALTTGIKSKLREEDFNQMLRRRQHAEEVIGVKNEQGRQSALLSGDHAQVVRLDDQSDFMKKFTEYFAINGNVNQSRDQAQQFVNNSIALQANQSSLDINHAAAASSLAKIGGGGNVADVSNEAIDIQRRQRDLQEDMVKLLTELTKAGGLIMQ